MVVVVVALVAAVVKEVGEEREGVEVGAVAEVVGEEREWKEVEEREKEVVAIVVSQQRWQRK